MSARHTPRCYVVPMPTPCCSRVCAQILATLSVMWCSLTRSLWSVCYKSNLFVIYTVSVYVWVVKIHLNDLALTHLSKLTTVCLWQPAKPVNVAVQLLSEEYSQMSPGTLEAYGLAPTSQKQEEDNLGDSAKKLSGRLTMHVYRAIIDEKYRKNLEWLERIFDTVKAVFWRE